ncbi:MAG TPA: tRNA (adenosine(37)-N6)-threonylcarbamoyltransferase complex transferase subunit TsaD [Solirubrobacteraceae bacterium]|nr:tRNA (adenosine(37)-N6)-threonylcarbamoyltransferase complex transferase subunit TsaD [Solirubrobacteraceae bacterium]
MRVLALETSCDDTCAAVVAGDGRIEANVISSQQVHDRFGGVVPEIASRHHLELVNLVVEQALSDAGVSLEEIDLVAATQGPGLVGALLVGLSTAKALAAARELPFAPVDHLQGHVAANFLAGDDGTPPFAPPFLCLIASGGHTLLTEVSEHDGFTVLGRTLDDAAGEAFDKGARMLGLGYPGGAALERLAAGGDPDAFTFPGSRRDRSRGGRGPGRQAFANSLDFSFAGLKTALLYRLRELSEQEARERASDLAASYQAAIVDSLMHRAEQALERRGLDRLAVGGGVAANGELRRRLKALDAKVHVPPRELCTDNAAMIAAAALHGGQLAYPRYLGLDAYATGEGSR